MRTDNSSVVAPATHGSSRTSGTLIGLCATVLVATSALLVVMFSREHPFGASRMTPTERAAATLEALEQTWTREATNAAQRARTAFQKAGAVFTEKLVPAGTPQLPAPTGFAHLSFGMPTDGLLHWDDSLKEIKWTEYVIDPQTRTLQEFELRYHALDLPPTDFYATLIKRFGAPSEIGEVVLVAGMFGPDARQEIRWHWPKQDVDVILVVQTTLGVDEQPRSFYPFVTFAKGRTARARAAALTEKNHAQAKAAERASILARLKDTP